MTGNVKFLWDSLDVPTALRNIAEDIEAGKFENTTATVIVGSEVFAVGQLKGDGDAAMNVIWDCNYAIAKLMKAATRGFD